MGMKVRIFRVEFFSWIFYFTIFLSIGKFRFVCAIVRIYYADEDYASGM